MALFIVALLNINTYAAVSANDGSAFITKAEFDAIVNTFNEQMDNYQASIVSKVDGAIANYIAGLSSVLTTEKNLFFSKWEDISCFSGVMDPTFEVPNVNIFIGGGINNEYKWDSNKYIKHFAQPISVRLTNSDAAGVIRPLVTNKTDEASGGGETYWAGIAEKYKENYAMSLSIYTAGTSDMANVEASSGTGTYQFQNVTRIVVNNGYNSSFATANTVINPTVQWKGPGVSYWNAITFSNKTAASVASVELGTNSAGKTTVYDHIIQYSGDNEWWVSNQKFTKTFMKHSKNGNKASNLLSKVNKNVNIASLAYAFESGQNPYSKRRYSISVEYTTPNNDIIPSVGMFSAVKKAKNIYLTSEEVSYEEKNTSKTLTNKTLEKGFPLFWAEKDIEINWSPKFTVGKTYGSTGWTNSTASRVKLMLSIGEFSDKIASTNLIDATSASGKTTDGGVLCTIGTNELVTFKMPKDGIVYAKWVPDVSNYDSTRWIQPLSLKECSTYTETTE